MNEDLIPEGITARVFVNTLGRRRVPEDSIVIARESGGLIRMLEKALHDRGFPVPALTESDARFSFTIDSLAGSHKVTAEYWPDPRRGVEFRGDVRDGDTVKLETAMELVEFTAIESGPIHDEWEYPHAFVPTRRVTYRRAGVNPVTGLWVYITQ